MSCRGLSVYNRQPPSLSELTPYEILLELTHLDSEASNNADISI